MDGSHIYLYAEALKRGEFSHLPVCRGITMWTVLIQCGEFYHLPVC